jgi:hypothetical protein
MALNLAPENSGVALSNNGSGGDFHELTTRFVEQRIGLGSTFYRAGFTAARPVAK